MAICIGIDAAKVVHWAVGIDGRGRVVLDRAVKNNPADIDALIADLRALEGDVVIGIDVVGSSARFIEASLLAEGFALVHTPGIAANRAGQGFAGGERKSDPRDARTIAELVRTRDLPPVLSDDDTRVALRLKVGHRRDQMQDQLRRVARIRGLLCGIHPGLEQVFDLCCKGPLALLTRYVTPAEIRRAGKALITAHLKKTPHPHGGEFLAAAAGLAPVQRQSGKRSGWRRAYGGDKTLKQVFYQSAFCAVTRKEPLSKAFYDRKRKEGKYHSQALVALARRRVTALWTMLKRRETFDPKRNAA